MIIALILTFVFISLIPTEEKATVKAIRNDYGEWF